MIKRVDKVKRVVAISVITIMISLTGCGKAKDSGKEVTTKQVNNEATSKQSVSGESDEAINELLNNIEVNGKHIDFPFTLNDLGDEFDFDYYVDMGDGTYGMDLKYKGETVAGAYVYADAEKDIDRNSLIINMSTNGAYKQIFTINNVDCNSDIEDVKKYMNKFKINYDVNEKATGIEYEDGKLIFSLYFSEEGKLVNSMYVIEKGENE